MKKLWISGALAMVVSGTASADYLMELKDQNGTLLDSQCVISYSYSNNSKSIESPKVRKVQRYSTEETLTNIVYLDRPVYRRVIPVDGVYNRNLGSFPEIDFLVSDVINMRQAGGANTFSGYDVTNYYSDIRLNANKTLDLASNFSSSWGYFGEVVIEYTKIGDYGVSGNDSYKEYAHYVLSSDTSEQVVTKIINEKSITFTGGYSWDDVNGTCSL